MSSGGVSAAYGLMADKCSIVDKKYAKTEKGD